MIPLKLKLSSSDWLMICFYLEANIKAYRQNHQSAYSRCVMYCIINARDKIKSKKTLMFKQKPFTLTFDLATCYAFIEFTNYMSCTDEFIYVIVQELLSRINEHLENLNIH